MKWIKIEDISTNPLKDGAWYLVEYREEKKSKHWDPEDDREHGYDSFLKYNKKKNELYTIGISCGCCIDNACFTPSADYITHYMEVQWPEGIKRIKLKKPKPAKYIPDPPSNWSISLKATFGEDPYDDKVVKIIQDAPHISRVLND